MISLIYGILKTYTNELIYEIERLTDTENKLIITKGGEGGGGGR